MFLFILFGDGRTGISMSSNVSAVDPCCDIVLQSVVFPL